MSFSLDNEQFISEVQKWPILWDVTSSTSYKQKKFKQKAWAEVAKVIISNFDEMSEAKKMNVYNTLQGKWRNLRDNYVRSMRRCANNGGKQYAYSNSMRFLDQVYQNRQNKKSKKTDEDTIKEVDIKQSISSSDEESPSVSVIDNFKRKRQESEKPVFLEMPTVTDDYYQASSSFQDEDRMFFDSLLPAVREFDLDQKLEFRTQVLQLIKKFRSNACVNSIKISHSDFED